MRESGLPPQRKSQPFSLEDETFKKESMSAAATAGSG